MPDPSRKDLLKKLASKGKVQLTTRCGTFEQYSGTIKEVFETFLLFITEDERDGTPIRHWVWLDNIALITEESIAASDESVEVTRFEM